MIAPGSERATEAMAHAAAIADLPLAANCIEAAPGDPATVTRLRWGGSLLEQARLHGAVKLLTVAPHTVEATAAAAPVQTAVVGVHARRWPTPTWSSRVVGARRRPTPAAASRWPTPRWS